LRDPQIVLPWKHCRERMRGNFVGKRQHGANGGFEISIPYSRREDAKPVTQSVAAYPHYDRRVSKAPQLISDHGCGLVV
jgi:hypothetical protein